MNIGDEVVDSTDSHDVEFRWADAAYLGADSEAPIFGLCEWVWVVSGSFLDVEASSPAGWT